MAKLFSSSWSSSLKRVTQSALRIPTPYLVRSQSLSSTKNNGVSAVDSAIAIPDIDDEVEYVSHGSGTFGILTKEQQRNALASRSAHVSIDDQSR